MFKEIHKLAYMLACTCIPYEMTEFLNGYHIEYPNHEDCICSVICNDYSYGHEDGLLEIMGLLTEEEKLADGVVGYLDADDVFNRISTDYFNKQVEDKMFKKKNVVNNNDMVNHPNHYQVMDGVEAIDIIKALLGDTFISYCYGNVIKYILRANKKNGLEDCKKAKVYLDWVIEEAERLNKK